MICRFIFRFFDIDMLIAVSYNVKDDDGNSDCDGFILSKMWEILYQGGVHLWFETLLLHNDN